MPRTPWIIAAATLALATAAVIDTTATATSDEPPHLRITSVTDTVQLTNHAPGPLDLTGWTLTGPNQQPYALSGALEPGASTRIPAANPLGTHVLRDPRGVTAHACRTTRVRTSLPCPTNTR